MKDIEDWPDVIRIDRSAYRLIVTKEIEDHGSCDVEEREIKIKPQSPYEDVDTLFHEFLHGVEHEYSVKLSHRQIYQLARALSRFVLDNPELFQNGS